MNTDDIRLRALELSLASTSSKATGQIATTEEIMERATTFVQYIIAGEVPKDKS